MKYLILVLPLFLLGCATEVTGSCKAIYPSTKDLLTRGTKEQILTHNETTGEGLNR